MFSLSSYLDLTFRKLGLNRDRANIHENTKTTSTSLYQRLWTNNINIPAILLLIVIDDNDDDNDDEMMIFKDFDEIACSTELFISHG